MKKTIILAIVSIALSAACSPKPELSFNETLDISATGGNVSVDVTANYPWTASSSSSWITITASGEEFLGLYISVNGAYESRTGNVTLVCEDIVKVLKVTQDQKDIIITDGGETIDIESTAQDLVINIQGNISYQCQVESSASSWLSLVESKSLVSSKVTLHAEENVSYESRSAKVTLKNTERGYNKTITVVQEGKPQVLKVTHHLKSFTIPVFEGTDFSAKVDWGDGKVEKYQAYAVHYYASEKTYCVSIKAHNMSVFTVSSLSGIDAIDFSGI